MNDDTTHVIKNSAGEYLVFMSGTGDRGPRWHHQFKFAKRYRTMRGCRNAATKFARRCSGLTFTATRVQLVPA